MNAHHNEIARLRRERDEALEQVRCLVSERAEMVGQGLPPLRGFSGRESRIIRCLEAANGRIVSIEGLMRALYFERGGGWPDNKIIPVTISQIRAKSPEYRHRFRNSYGQGYAMEPVP